MNSRLRLPCIVVAGVLASRVTAAEPPASDEAIHLTIPQDEHLWIEPVLVTVRLASERFYLPAGPGESKLGTLRFEFDPPVAPRAGGKPLPLEAQSDANVQIRDYDLFEWFAFPEQGGSWTVRATFLHKGATLQSKPVTFRIRRPAGNDRELAAVARIHHAPWSNYDTNAFCGDCFDVVKQWPDSRLARVSHYWNGRFQQNKGEYDKAIASFRTVVAKYPDFALADDAEFGIVECLYAQKKMDEAQKLNTALRQKLNDRLARTGIQPGTARTVVQALAHGMTHRINRDLGLE